MIPRRVYLRRLPARLFLRLVVCPLKGHRWATVYTRGRLSGRAVPFERECLRCEAATELPRGVVGQ